MIGQGQLKKKLTTLWKNNKLPRFIILVGDKGSGKKTLLKEIFNDVYTYTLEDVKVDSIREMIDNVYKLYQYVFIIPDADDMSVQSKNALLKVVEECPNNHHFIMTLEDINNTLDTIKSRGVVYEMDNYSRDELYSYLLKYYELTSSKDEMNVCLGICGNPGEIDLLMSMEPIYFYDYVEKVVDNITEVSGANSFKIANDIALKDEEDKYNLKLFWKEFIHVCYNNKKYEWVLITSDYLKKLRVKGINKTMLFDNWILEIRQNGSK